MTDVAWSGDAVRMRHLLPILALFALSCADAPPPRAAYQRPAPQQAACASELECSFAYQQAVARARSCRTGAGTGIALIDAASRAGGCGAEDAAVQNAGQRMAWFQQQARQQAIVSEHDAARERMDTAKRQRVEALQAAEVERLAAIKRNEELRKELTAEGERVQAERDAADWLVLDVKGCTDRGDPRACAQIEHFITSHAGSPHQAEAGDALRAGRDKIAVVEEQEAAKLKRSASAPRVTRPAQPVAAPEPEAPHVCCCDKTRSPDCVTPHAGCCADHGGACPCQ